MRAIVLSAALALGAAQSAWAWGDAGHSIVAEIAQHRLSDVSRQVVDRLLNHGSLASVSSWADDVKFTTRPDTKPWHFVNIPLEHSTYDGASDCQGSCIIPALTLLKTDLQCAQGDDGKRDALRFVVHLVGDLHQPLHTVKEGGGGNDIIVSAKFCGLKSPGCTIAEPAKVKFHELWDGTLIANTFYDWGAYVDRLEQGWLKTSDAKTVSEETEPVETALARWALATHSEAQAIWHRKPDSNVIDESYYNDVLPVLDRQLGAGGIRLARFLNDAYSTPAACPAR